MKFWHEWTDYKPDMIFVFGSNRGGRNGKGAALFAKRHCGAIDGQGYGLHGNSYAIPTKSSDLETLPLWMIDEEVERFLWIASRATDTVFYVTALGTGLAGYAHEQIAPMFRGAPDNCLLPPEWKAILERKET